LTVERANPEDAHRLLEKRHNLSASLSHVGTRQVRNDYALRSAGKFYLIERQAVMSGLRQAHVRVEERLDRWRCAVADQPIPQRPRKPAKQHRVNLRGSERNRNFDRKKAPKIWQAAQESGRRRGGDIG
jgi:hypothetical protein